MGQINGLVLASNIYSNICLQKNDSSAIHSFLFQGAVPLSQQLRNFKEYQFKVKAIAGEENATELIRESIYLLSAGSSDYVQNYYINPLINKLRTPDQFADLLLQSFSSFVKVSFWICKSVLNYIFY